MELKNRLENETRELQNQMMEYERNLRTLHNEIKTLQDMERKLRDEKVLLIRHYTCDHRFLNIFDICHYSFVLLLLGDAYDGKEAIA
jgi:hypothetical protein